MLDFGLLVELDNNRYFNQTAQQTSADVQPMQTYYNFTCGPVDLNLTFTAPLFMDNLDLMARPVNYISYEVISNDGQAHQVELYFEAAPQWALDLPHQESVADSFTDGDLLFLRTGSRNQDILKRKVTMYVLTGDTSTWLLKKRTALMLSVTERNFAKALQRTNWKLLPPMVMTN